MDRRYVASVSRASVIVVLIVGDLNILTEDFSFIRRVAVYSKLSVAARNTSIIFLSKKCTIGYNFINN